MSTTGGGSVTQWIGDLKTGADFDRTLIAVRAGDFPAPRRVDSAIAPALEAICLRAMALRPDDRYANPRDLAADIERWPADEPVSALREPIVDRALLDAAASPARRLRCRCPRRRAARLGRVGEPADVPRPTTRRPQRQADRRQHLAADGPRERAGRAKVGPGPIRAGDGLDQGPALRRHGRCDPPSPRSERVARQAPPWHPRSVSHARPLAPGSRPRRPRRPHRARLGLLPGRRADSRSRLDGGRDPGFPRVAGTPDGTDARPTDRRRSPIRDGPQPQQHRRHAGPHRATRCRPESLSRDIATLRVAGARLPRRSHPSYECGQRPTQPRRTARRDGPARRGDPLLHRGADAARRAGTRPPRRCHAPLQPGRQQRRSRQTARPDGPARRRPRGRPRGAEAMRSTGTRTSRRPRIPHLAGTQPHQHRPSAPRTRTVRRRPPGLRRVARPAQGGGARTTRGPPAPVIPGIYTSKHRHHSR